MPKRQRPTPDELNALLQEHTQIEIAQMCGVSDRTVREWRDEYKKQEATPAPEFLDLKETEIDWREVLTLADQMQQIHDKAFPGQHSAKIAIKADKPITVVWTSDWHLGGMATDHRQFMENTEYILKTPGVYLGVVGDEIDNFTQFRSVRAVLEQVLTPELQKGVLTKILTELVDSGKLLFTAWGNHNVEFDERIGGSSMRAYVYDKVPHLEDDGFVELTVGEQPYTVLAQHLARYNSAFNKTWSAKQLFRMRYPADMVVVGHTHVADFETFYHYDKQNFLFRIGTYKLNDTHSRRRYGKPELGTPAVVLFPDKREMVPFLRVDQAVRYMHSLW